MERRPKITFITLKWPPAMGGMETYSKELSTRLAKKFDVRLIALAGKTDGSTPSVLQLAGFGLLTAFQLLFSRSPADVVHVADMASWPLAFVARLRQSSTVRVISAHGTDVTYPLRGGVVGGIYGAYLRLGAMVLGDVRVIANSQATACVASRYGFRDVFVVPLAADVVLCENVTSIRERKLLFSGRLIKLKGASWFVRSVLSRLPEDMTLDVAGTIWDEEERQALNMPRVNYLGKLDQAALWRAQAEALCVVLPNIPLPSGQFEGFGLVAVEASAAGGVVLAARHGGLIDAVIDGKTGFLLPPEDADAWIARILEVADWTSNMRTAFVAGSVAATNKHFSWSRVVNETTRHYGLAVHAD